ncbi:uncharacterized protein EDB91DRAFT_453561 [Suillus paluster]|uniref:uncharacterized protein n=1 Tax=Suillus paluster TaxID=48578 RepID=UPI001B86BCE7|nr:uncharacterized protein EDB91DRAFT_453561 [Suillus paluster]KAG1738334.1 hypothetical protein EDB91DRAFT_453561 [Suillus paluster]
MFRSGLLSFVKGAQAWLALLFVLILLLFHRVVVSFPPPFRTQYASRSLVHTLLCYSSKRKTYFGDAKPSLFHLILNASVGNHPLHFYLSVIHHCQYAWPSEA